MRAVTAVLLRKFMAGLAFGVVTLSACTATPTSPSSAELGVGLSTATSSIVLTQGDRASVDVTISRSGGFSGPVTLAVSGVPPGVAADIATNPVTGNSASMTISVGDAATAGDYSLTLAATSDGIARQALPLTLQVAQRNAVAVSIPYCNGSEPSWAAFQDGDGVWTRLQSTTGGGITIFRAVLSTNRGALATVRFFDGGMTSLLVQFGTPTEIAAAGDTSRQHCGPAVSRTLLGSVAGLGSDEYAFVSSAIPARAAAYPVRPDFSLNGLAAGPQDLLATRNSPATGSSLVTALILRRDLDLPDSTTIPVLDFGSGEPFAPAVANVFVNGVGPEGVTVATRLLTSHDDIPLTMATTGTSDPAHPYYAVPEAQLLPTDLQILYVYANPTTAGGLRSTAQYFHAPMDRTIALGAPLTAPTFSTVATVPTLRVRAQFVPQGDYDQFAAVTYQQGANTLVSVSITAAYATLSGTHALVVPELTGLTGFKAAWALQPGSSFSWTAVGTGGTLGSLPRDGDVQRSAESAGTIEP